MGNDLAEARRAAAAEEVGSVGFEEGDADTHRFAAGAFAPADAWPARRPPVPRRTTWTNRAPRPQPMTAIAEAVSAALRPYDRGGAVGLRGTAWLNHRPET
ncbi:hypothetical protein [Streptomyces sp. SBT349]|uniref:hypothetical protein n=1 Tax=Streptomyces sp. SBT349 TaxID=1580539 RepID=UPI00066B8FDA|nr:hypothetical protein [Streptomyces sp. SBT349]